MAKSVFIEGGRAANCVMISQCEVKLDVWVKSAVWQEIASNLKNSIVLIENCSQHQQSHSFLNHFQAATESWQLLISVQWVWI